MLDALAIVIPFILVSAPLKKVLAYSQAHNRAGQGWFIALVAGSLCLLSMVFLHFFPTFDPAITLVDYGLGLFAAGVILRALTQSAEKGKLSLQFFYPVVFLLALGLLFFIAPQGFYGFTSGGLLWAERLLTAFAWVLFATLFSKQDGVKGNVALQALVISVALSVVAKGVALYALILAGSCMGFMRFNTPKGLVKMGFSGGFWLGFILFGLAAISLIPHPLTNPDSLTLITLFMLPVVDSLQAFIKTLTKKGHFTANLWATQLVQHGASPQGALLRSMSVHFLLFLAAILGYVAQQSLYTLLFGAFVLALYHTYVWWVCKPTVTAKPPRKTGRHN